VSKSAFLQTGSPSSHPTNSVKAKTKYNKRRLKTGMLTNKDE